MPSSIQAAAPTAVFPASLSRAFSEVQTYTARVSEYHDGSNQRDALATVPRRVWQLTKRLPSAGLVTLRDFMDLHVADSFYFYSPKEAVPPYSADPTGADPTGRYIVRVNSGWSQNCGIALTDAAVELIEVAAAVL